MLRSIQRITELAGKKGRERILQQGSTLRKNFINPAGLVTETFTSPEIFLLALILMTTLFK